MSTSVASLGSPAWQRVLITWMVLAVVMSMNGIFRELVLRRFASAQTSGIVSAALGIALVLAVSHALFPTLTGYTTGALIQTSVVLVVLTVAFETALGILIDHKSWQELLAHYALWRGELWPIVLATIAITPFVWGRWWPR